MSNQRKLITFLTIMAITLSFTGCIPTSDQASSNHGDQTTQPSVNEPEILELRIDQVLTTTGHPEIKDTQAIKFFLSVGERVEGEVTTSTNDIISSVYDPYGNLLVGSARRDETFTINQPTGKVIGHRIVSTQQYPWKFAFLAATEGKYSIQVYATTASLPYAHIKLTIFRS